MVMPTAAAASGMLSSFCCVWLPRPESTCAHAPTVTCPPSLQEGAEESRRHSAHAGRLPGSGVQQGVP